jgi:hypothetical protein
MFPGPPDVYLGLEDLVPDLLLRECAAECCGIPEDGVVVIEVDVDNWLLAPHEECGDEPQCGPVVVRTSSGFGYEFEIETVETTVTINVLDLAAEQGSPSEPWLYEWIFAAHTVPRPGSDHLIDVEVYRFLMFDEPAQRDEDVFLCRGEEGRFHVYADISPTTPPGTYVMRAGLDDVEVACTFGVSSGEDGLAKIDIPSDACAPAGLVAFSHVEIAEGPDAPAGYRRAQLEPREPVERHEPTSELTFPAGEECTLIPCQIAPAWGLTL